MGLVWEMGLMEKLAMSLVPAQLPAPSPDLQGLTDLLMQLLPLGFLSMKTCKSYKAREWLADSSYNSLAGG